MTEPKYVTRWQGITGRSTSLLIGTAQMFVCSECATLVVDQERHTAWHCYTNGSQ